MPAVLNAANEEAVEAFLQERIAFPRHSPGDWGGARDTSKQRTADHRRYISRRQVG